MLNYYYFDDTKNKYNPNIFLSENWSNAEMILHLNFNWTVRLPIESTLKVIQRFVFNSILYYFIYL